MNHKEIQRCLERCRDSVERYGERWRVFRANLWGTFSAAALAAWNLMPFRWLPWGKHSTQKI